MSLRAILAKDLRREWRSKESLLAGLVLVGLFYILFIFVGGTTDRIAVLALWTPLLYATAAINGRGLSGEADRGTLEWILSTPAPGAWHGWSRTLVDLLATALMAAASLVLVTATFGTPITWSLVAIMALGTLGLGTIGAMVGGIAAQAKLRDILLPLLLLPAAAPLVQAGVTATMDAFAGADVSVPLQLMAGFDLIALGLAWLLWPHILGAD